MSVSMGFVDDPYFASTILLQRDRVVAEDAYAGDPAPAGLPIEMTGLRKAFGTRTVLDGVDLSIRAGSFVAVVGRSGGGKSTLLRLLAGLEPATSGSVAIGRRVVAGPQASARLMFQDPRLLPWQSVASNVGIARGPGWRSAAMKALDAVGLADRADEWPSVLSGGQRQRVALARALVSRPNILLLDEPFGALDAMTRTEMHQLVARLWVEQGFTAVLITHDVAEAISLADRVLVLRDGRVALDVEVPFARRHRDASDPAVATLRARILAEV